MGIIRSDMGEASEEQKIQLLAKVTKELNKHNIDYWLESGTLLGLIREKKLIPWDADIDIATTEIEKVENLQFNKDLETEVCNELGRYEIIRVRDKNISHTTNMHVDIMEFRLDNGRPTYPIALRKNYITRIANTLQEAMVGGYVKGGVTSIETMKRLGNLLQHLPLKGLLIKILTKVDFFFVTQKIFIYNPVTTKEVLFYDIPVKIPSNAEEHLLLYFGKNWKSPDKHFSEWGSEFESGKQGRITICKMK